MTDAQVRRYYRAALTIAELEMKRSKEELKYHEKRAGTIDDSVCCLYHARRIMDIQTAIHHMEQGSITIMEAIDWIINRAGEDAV